MTELDKIRIKEFVQDVAKYDEVYGLTKKEVSSLFSLVKMIATKSRILCLYGVLKQSVKSSR